MNIFGRSGSVSLLSVKPPAVAGTFYPAEPDVLRQQVRAFVAGASADSRDSEALGALAPKAIIAPHAGYRYSGAVAGSAYARFGPAANAVRTVVLLGPAHRVALRGLAASSAGVFRTPLGDIEVDAAAVRRALAFEQVQRLDAAFAQEHSLEVHLPFVKECFPAARVVPLLVGETAPSQVGEVLDALWGGPETVIVISSDLSHYHDYETAKRMDSATSRSIEALRESDIGYEDACGRHAVNGLLTLARAKGLQATTLDLRNSGDTAGPRDRVVGYGAYAFAEAEESRLDFAQRRQLLGLAANSMRHGLEHGTPRPVDPGEYPPALQAVRASFVTIELDGKLRGCMGTLRGTLPLVTDVVRNAYNAAFGDPRFSPVTAEELVQLDISVSVLSPPSAMNFQSESDLVSQLRPNIDGLILQDGDHRGTFLPAVWKSLPDPAQFVRHLKRKAGLREDHWSSSIQVARYTTESFD